MSGGVTTVDPPLDQQPGWWATGYALRPDDTSYYDNLFINPGAHVSYGPIGSDDTIAYDRFYVNNLFVQNNATFSLLGGIEGVPSAEQMNAGNVFLSPGSTLIIGANGDYAPDGLTHINEIFNYGGTIATSSPTVPSGTPIQFSGAQILLGGIGFITFDVMAHESEVNDQAGHTVINAGNVQQGSGVTPFLAALNEPVYSVGSESFTSDAGFALPNPQDLLQNTSFGPGATNGGIITVDLNGNASLGAHRAVLSFDGPGVHHSLTFIDNIVAAHS